MAFVLGAVLMADAQYKPTGGDKNLEVNFSPLGGSPVSIFGIKARQFKDGGSALRLGVFIGLESSSEITQDADSELDLLETKDQMSSFSISIQPGIEKHMEGTDRLSPYTGAYVSIGYTSTTDKMETQWDADNIGTQTDKSGALNLGLNAVAGMDWYFTENAYLGIEMGFGVAYSSDLTNKTTFEGFDPNPDDAEGTVGNTNSFQLGPNVVAQLRLGWLLK
jgi:hypothetical protein